MKKKSRPKEIERLIRSVWESLESHLHWTHAKSSEGTAFHRKCVQDYAEQLYRLSQLY